MPYFRGVLLAMRIDAELNPNLTKTLRRFVAESQTLRPMAIRALGLWSVVQQFGLDPVRFVTSVARLPQYTRDLVRFRRQAARAQHRIPIRSLKPELGDYSDSAGMARGHYFHQDLWAARRIFALRPDQHLDVGSRIDGFVAHLLSFMPVKVVDVRPLLSDVPGLEFVQSDATSLDAWSDNSMMSVSSLHAVEHFGLGRYGDPIDPDGSFKAMRALSRVLKPGGRLYFSVPIGVERIEFNAHRVFSPETILDTFLQSGLSLVRFDAVDDHGALRTDVQPSDFARAEYACGLFEFTK